MKAIIYNKYGPSHVLKLMNIEKPIPKDDEVLVKIHASSVNPLDWHTMRGTPYLVRLQSGLSGPKNNRLGSDMAGQVEAVGKNVKGFQPGDEVFGGGNGTFAEYVCTSEKLLVKKPANVTFEQAAALPIAAFTALQGLRDHGRIKSGQKVLINGAAGGVGTFAVQIAKSMGAEVTGVCSTRNVEMVQSIGADHVIDYTQEDFTLSQKSYDLIFDTIGNHPLLKCRSVLSEDGTLLMVGSQSNGKFLGPLARSIRGLLMTRFISQRFIMFIAMWKKEDLIVLQELIDSGKVTPVIDRCYSLNEVPEAIRYLEKGHARGKVVISLK
ncbi:NAD(P)-dependent alcohol dehydrogenase [Bacillus sp. CGMCC 1.16607]|uniref:NAD(P)-dependent alcohol dehydrogenase n=1 Tax=Bacillus sp. CGMCC 1.16607 TaxID=3351842 RepID=UPI00363889FD